MWKNIVEADRAQMTIWHMRIACWISKATDTHFSSLLLLGAQLPLMVKSFSLLNDIFPFPSILDTGYPVFNLHLANILFDIILPSVLGSSLSYFG